MLSVLRWVHTCNVTAYRTAVTLQVTDTIRSYELNFHPAPHGVTVYCERYTVGFPVCYGSPNDVFAASNGFVHLYTLRFKEKEKRATVVACHVARPDLLRPYPYHPFDSTAKYRQHTEQARNVTRSQSRPHCHDTVVR
jgi:hypothetical protein